MPLSSASNQFSVLHVDSIPEIKEPVESPPVVPPKANPPAPSRKRKPNWEKRIPNHLVIDTLDEKEGRRRSLTLKIELQTTDMAETKSVTALLDSKATGMFIDWEYVKKSGFTTRTLSNPIPVRNVDGCQRTPQSTSHYSRLPQQSPIHPSTQTTKPPDRSLTYVSDLRVRPTCPTYVSDLRVQPTCQAYVSTLRVQLSDHIIILIIYLR